MKKEEVCISYSWAPKTKDGKNYEKIIASIEKSLKKDFKVIIDKKDVEYKGNIKEFEKRLGRSEKVVLLISDKYLKSKHCMFEILQIQENGKVYDRIFPVVLDDALIHDSTQAADYIKYWENEEEKLNVTLKSLKSQANTSTIRQDLDNCAKYRAMFDDFRGLLSNMNTLNPAIHKETNFKELVNALKGSKPHKKKDSKQQRDFENRISLTNKLFEKSIEIISKEIRDENIKASEILESIKQSYQQCKNQIFQIAVMAMVKSGKSTFLNALLGNEFLPMANVPETSVPVKINHSDNSNGVLLNGKSKIEGATKIKSHLESINAEKRKKGFQFEVEFNLHAPFKVLEEKKMTGIKFEILDTPGFGEAITEITVGKSIDQSNTELIDKISAIIYILDYTKLKTEDEDSVLEKLTKMRSDIFEKIQDRMFFIINKIDEENRHSLSPDKAIDYVFNLISAKMPNVLRQHFLTLSASEALDARLILNGNASAEVKQDFGKVAFGRKAGVMDESAYSKEASEVLLSSGILQVENNIINYIFENRSRIFIEGIQDNLKRLLKEFKNKFVITAEGTLSRTIQDIEILERKIEEAKKKQENIQEDAEKFEKEIRDWIDVEFEKFSTTVTDNIDSVFNSDKVEEKQKWYSKLIPNWVKNIQREIKEAEDQSDQSSKEDIENLVRDINYKINHELSKSFAEFKKQLEQKLVTKQMSLFEKLKNTINSLASAFEETLKKALHINYEIVEVRLDTIDFDKSLIDADSYIDRFVKSNTKSEFVEKNVSVYNPDKNCWFGGYDDHTVFVQQLVAVNSISKSGLELYWKKMINEKNTNAKKLTNYLFEQNIKQQIKNARNGFNRYVGDYTTTIQEQKAKLSSGSTDEIQQRLKTLGTLKENISSIIDELEGNDQ
jgi:GTPase SAR1 family protein